MSEKNQGGGDFLTHTAHSTRLLTILATVVLGQTSELLRQLS